MKNIYVIITNSEYELLSKLDKGWRDYWTTGDRSERLIHDYYNVLILLGKDWLFIVMVSGKFKN